MKNIWGNKLLTASMIMPFLFCGCSPLVPSNYLGPGSIQSSQRVNGQQIRPRLIPINVQTLNSSQGRFLLADALHNPDYRIGAYDTLNIIVWGHPEVSTISTSVLENSYNTTTPMTANNPAVNVQSDGTIYYPYVGQLEVAGLTINEVRERITNRLSRYIRNPQVTVQVEKYSHRYVYVLGEVKHPGLQPLTDKPLSLMEAISNAGDINTNTADPSHIYLVRGSYLTPDVFWLNAQTPQALMIAEKFPLREYDIVYVSAATLSPWNNFVNQILPSFSTYFTIKGLANK